MSATGGLRLAVEGLVAELVVELNRFFLLRLDLDPLGHDLISCLGCSARSLGGPKVAEP
jgi:hypothetical protein